MSLRLLLLLFVCCVDADISARLLLRLHCYSHPSNLRSDGSKCDSNTDCDPEFHFCFSSRPQSGYNCDLTRLAPLAFEDRSKLGSCAPDTDFPETLTFPLSTEASQLFLTLDIHDIDRSMSTTRKQEIDRLRFQVLPGLRALPNNATPTPEAFQRLPLTNRDFLGEDQPRVELRGVLVCSSGRFGARCEVNSSAQEVKVLKFWNCNIEDRSWPITGLLKAFVAICVIGAVCAIVGSILFYFRQRRLYLASRPIYEIDINFGKDELEMKDPLDSGLSNSMISRSSSSSLEFL